MKFNQRKLTVFLCFLLISAMLFSMTGCTEAEPAEEPFDGVQIVDGDYAGAIDSAEIGDTFIFGTFEQDNDKTNGREPIEWRVLDKNEKGVLLLSEYILEFGAYEHDGGDITWENAVYGHRGMTLKSINSRKKKQAISDGRA